MVELVIQLACYFLLGGPYLRSGEIDFCLGNMGMVFSNRSKELSLLQSLSSSMCLASPLSL